MPADSAIERAKAENQNLTIEKDVEIFNQATVTVTLSGAPGGAHDVKIEGLGI